MTGQIRPGGRPLRSRHCHGGENSWTREPRGSSVAQQPGRSMGGQSEKEHLPNFFPAVPVEYEVHEGI